MLAIEKNIFKNGSENIEFSSKIQNFSLKKWKTCPNNSADNQYPKK